MGDATVVSHRIPCSRLCVTSHPPTDVVGSPEDAKLLAAIKAAVRAEVDAVVVPAVCAVAVVGGSDVSEGEAVAGATVVVVVVFAAAAAAATAAAASCALGGGGRAVAEATAAVVVVVLTGGAGAE